VHRKRHHAVFLAVLLLCWAGSICCSLTAEEFSRLASPDGALDAVVYETNGGATEPFSYDLYVVAHGSSKWSGQHVAWFDAPGLNNNAYGIHVRWTSDDQLMVQYYSARRVDVSTLTPTVSGHRVSVEIKPGVKDPKAR
jgi:hypothetical protein